ncbi:MAG: glycoside hydrolase family 130 protein [Fimbriimonadales bacterium]|nr:glycoside hydrolase family 130 protein [Fimbriimonadales bacterium]
MRRPSLPVERLKVVLHPNPLRVLVRPFTPGIHLDVLGLRGEPSRIRRIAERVVALEEKVAQSALEDVLRLFESRHRQILETFRQRFEQLEPLLELPERPGEAKRLLLGATFTSEYSLEASALFNPSIVPHPDQSGLAEGELRFVLSLRATGEGHISSIVFRSGTLGPDGEIRLDKPTRYVTEGRLSPACPFHKQLFDRKLQELGLKDEFAQRVLDRLPDRFTDDHLASAVDAENPWQDEETERRAEAVLTVAHSNCRLSFEADTPISERVLFPVFPSQRNGIEDARFVLFKEEDGSQRYYATFTAYDGRTILSQLLETSDFVQFDLCTLNGPAVRDKGMALFPRRLNGLYAMLSRQDGETIRLMWSDNPHFWYESAPIVLPKEPWELIQLGNCGSPIETEEGWLVLTHGVGPMRRYCIGAVLLDRRDPSKVLGRLREPLLAPEPDEREGYVPNVLYTCGGIVHGRWLILPYAVSDTATRFARVELKALLGAMQEAPRA